jgi:glycosyltransferase involved in cell wall biosynthesis
MVKKNLIEFFAIQDSQVSVIHNAVKPFDGNIETIEALKRKKKERHILVGNIGRLSEQKGMSYFIDAAEIVTRSHPEVRFVIVGDGELKDQLHGYVKSKKLQDVIMFLGYRNDIQNVISQMDFIVLSSLWEGLPLTPIEAYSVGKTVIGTAVDGTQEIIRNGVDGTTKCLSNCRKDDITN